MKLVMNKNPVQKTVEQYFCDWYGDAFGFGYGTGERRIIPVLRQFLDLCRGNLGASYNYEELEKALGPAVAWLILDKLCQEQMIEYGTSPRFAWLTAAGVALRDFMCSKTEDELYEMAAGMEEECYRDVCNCGPDGQIKGLNCLNPFWGRP